MSGLSFVDRDQYTTVKLDGRMVGRILCFLVSGKPYGKPTAVHVWRYVPKGSASRGDAFETREACKASL